MTHRLHALRLEEMLSNPEKHIGISGVQWGCTELHHKTQDGRDGEIDLLLFTGDIYAAPFHVIEYKESPKYRGKAQYQLRRANQFIEDSFGEDSLMWFVYRRNNLYVAEQYLGK